MQNYLVIVRKLNSNDTTSFYIRANNREEAKAHFIKSPERSNYGAILYFDADWIFTITVLLTVFAVIFSEFCF